MEEDPWTNRPSGGETESVQNEEEDDGLEMQGGGLSSRASLNLHIAHKNSYNVDTSQVRLPVKTTCCHSCNTYNLMKCSNIVEKAAL